MVGTLKNIEPWILTTPCSRCLCGEFWFPTNNVQLHTLNLYFVEAAILPLWNQGFVFTTETPRTPRLNGGNVEEHRTLNFNHSVLSVSLWWILISNQQRSTPHSLSLIHIWRCRRIERCRSRWSRCLGGVNKTLIPKRQDCRFHEIKIRSVELNVVSWTLLVGNQNSPPRHREHGVVKIQRSMFFNVPTI